MGRMQEYAQQYINGESVRNIAQRYNISVSAVYQALKYCGVDNRDIKKQCVVCGTKLVDRSSNAMYCSERCNYRAYRRRKASMAVRVGNDGGNS